MSDTVAAVIEHDVPLPRWLWLSATSQFTGNDSAQLVEVIRRQGDQVTVMHPAWAMAHAVPAGELSERYPVETVIVKTREQLSAAAAEIAGEHARKRG